MRIYNSIMKIDECINYLLTQAQYKVNSLFKKNLLEYDITPAQYVLLYHLWNKDGLSPSQLSKLSGLDASTITGLLTRMENKNLIKRKHSKNDRRGVKVYLSQPGAELESSIGSVIEKSNELALQALDPAEQKAFKVYLERIAK